jgi:hypothetical protein
MTATAVAANVVYLDTHPGFRATRTRSEELLAAMRRHPSYQGDPLDAGEDRTNAQVLYIHPRRTRRPSA